MLQYIVVKLRQFKNTLSLPVVPPKFVALGIDITEQEQLLNTDWGIFVTGISINAGVAVLEPKQFTPTVAKSGHTDALTPSKKFINGEVEKQDSPADTNAIKLNVDSDVLF